MPRCCASRQSGWLAAFGPNPLDPRCRVVSAAAGRAQGRREAAGVAAFLGVTPT